MAGTEYAPAAIRAVYDRLCELRPGVEWQLGGILGDAGHTYGYHRARAVLPADDYSVTLRRDRGGPEWAASALDITPPDTQHQKRLTRRLARAIRDRDPRLTAVVREVYGSVNGFEVWGWDLATGSPQTSDDSHLWHVHLSFYRDTTARPQLLRGVADVLAGL